MRFSVRDTLWGMLVLALVTVVWNANRERDGREKAATVSCIVTEFRLQDGSRGYLACANISGSIEATPWATEYQLDDAPWRTIEPIVLHGGNLLVRYSPEPKVKGELQYYSLEVATAAGSVSRVLHSAVHVLPAGYSSAQIFSRVTESSHDGVQFFEFGFKERSGQRHSIKVRLAFEKVTR